MISVNVDEAGSHTIYGSTYRPIQRGVEARARTASELVICDGPRWRLPLVLSIFLAISHDEMRQTCRA